MDNKRTAEYKNENTDKQKDILGGDYTYKIVAHIQDEEGNDIKIILPSHKNLRRFYKRLNIGDYILVKLVDLKPIKRSKHKKRIYKVLVDDDQFVDYDEEW